MYYPIGVVLAALLLSMHFVLSVCAECAIVRFYLLLVVPAAAKNDVTACCPMSVVLCGFYYQACNNQPRN